MMCSAYQKIETLITFCCFHDFSFFLIVIKLPCMTSCTFLKRKVVGLKASAQPSAVLYSLFFDYHPRWRFFINNLILNHRIVLKQ